MDQAKIEEITALIDRASENEALSALGEMLPRELPSDARSSILFAAEAAKSARQTLADAIAAATDGKLAIAAAIAQEAHSSAALVTGRLKNAEMMRRAGR
jgi:hypothetical protein